MPDEEIVEQVEEEVEPTEDIEEGDEGTVEPEDDGLSEAEVKEGRNLYKLLKDKNQRTNVIRILAQQVGLLDAQTPKEVKQATKDLKTLVKEKLGKEYEFLSDKLGDVLESVLEAERAKIDERLGLVAQKDIK